MKNQNYDKKEVEETKNTALTIDDLLNAESEVLRRIGEDNGSDGPTMSGHYSNSSGHSSSGGHSSHSSAKIERPLKR